ncbi:MAG: LysE family transporter [Burkholderiaceae bacterium]|jgi:threonine/homoserine/homoserine lactone efflux protein|nr:LysE family transporter [Burkholderiaceae bacterium]
MHTFYFQQLLSLTLIYLLGIMAPGADFAVTIRQSLSFGKRTGVITVIGIGSGISVHVFYTLIGVGVLLRTQPTLFSIVKVISAAYMLYLGVKFIRSQPKISGLNTTAINQKMHPSPLRSFIIGFLTNATNPKATLLILAVFMTIVAAKTPIEIQIIYGLWMCAIAIGWFVAVSLLFSSHAIRRGFFNIGHWIERGMGILLISFAVNLLINNVK